MIKYIVLILAVAGGYYYVSRHCNLANAERLISEHKGASWAPRARYTVALFYDQREDYPKAQEAFTRLLSEYPTCQYVPSVLIHVDEVAQENQDWAAAKAALARYVEEFPEGKDIELARKRLEMLRYHHGP
ncbi:MAG: tetratricopeptide repeat protein [Elusimicrobiota bacterium]